MKRCEATHGMDSGFHTLFPEGSSSGLLQFRTFALLGRLDELRGEESEKASVSAREPPLKVIWSPVLHAGGTSMRPFAVEVPGRRHASM